MREKTEREMEMRNEGDDEGGDGWVEDFIKVGRLERIFVGENNRREIR